jgi:prefoldin subunit 5
MAFPQLSGIIARQVGSIQGKLVSQVQGQVLNVLSKFSSQCPNTKELEKIIRIKNNLLKNINALERRIQKLRSVANKLDASIRTARVAIEIIKRIPIPTVLTFIPGQAGGLVKGVPYSTLTKLSDRLIKLNKLLDALEADKQGILGVINTVSITLQSLKKRLEAIDVAIQGCTRDSTDAPQIVTSTQPPQNTGSEGTPNDDYLYKGYILEIVEDPNSPKIAPKRYAIAKDKAGVIVLYGPSSFSSDTQVLLDEVKFRIDNQLP